MNTQIILALLVAACAVVHAFPEHEFEIEKAHHREKRGICFLSKHCCDDCMTKADEKKSERDKKREELESAKHALNDAKSKLGDAERDYTAKTTDLNNKKNEITEQKDACLKKAKDGEQSHKVESSKLEGERKLVQTQRDNNQKALDAANKKVALLESNLKKANDKLRQATSDVAAQKQNIKKEILLKTNVDNSLKTNKAQMDRNLVQETGVTSDLDRKLTQLKNSVEATSQKLNIETKALQQLQLRAQILEQQKNKCLQDLQRQSRK